MKPITEQSIGLRQGSMAGESATDSFHTGLPNRQALVIRISKQKGEG